MDHLMVFDIDGTLINVQGAGHRAMDRAFTDFYGVAHAFEGISFAGQTDRGALNLAAQRHHVTIRSEDLHTFQTLFASHLQEELQRAPGHVLPGLPDLLFLLQSEGFYLALGTGNFKISAYLKLAPFDMAGFFPAGGFGDDGITRLEVLTYAIKRAATHYQKTWDRVTVFGDTPGDMQAARSLQAFGLGVATGPYSKAELESGGAQAVLNDLSNLDSVRKQLGS